MQDMPKIPIQLFELIHNISMFLLLDDKHDIGRFSYHNRTDYYWKGRYSPDHPSPLHHWYIGWLGLLTAQIGAIAVKGLEVAETYNSIQQGDMSAVDPDILELFEENGPVELEDYKEEVKALPEQKPSQASPLNDGLLVCDSRSKLVVPKPRLLL